MWKPCRNSLHSSITTVKSTQVRKKECLGPYSCANQLRIINGRVKQTVKPLADGGVS